MGPVLLLSHDTDGMGWPQYGSAEALGLSNVIDSMAQQNYRARLGPSTASLLRNNVPTLYHWQYGWAPTLGPFKVINHIFVRSNGPTPCHWYHG
jgi:hypothetical protein